MKNLNKLIICCLIGTMALSLFVSVASAQTLKEKDQQAKAKYQAAQEQYLREVNWWKTSRQQFLDAKTKYQNFKNAENKTAYEEQARVFLEKTIDVLIQKLETLKNWVSNQRAISETERQNIITEIEQDIKWLQDKKSGIATASPAQIKEKAGEIREYWGNHRVMVKRITGQILAARASFVIDKVEGFSSRVSQKIEELKAAGRDTTQLEVLFADFNQKLSLAREKYAAAKAKFQSISSLADANQLFSQGHQFIKEANQYIRDAHKKLVDIVKEMKRLGASVEIAE